MDDNAVWFIAVVILFVVMSRRHTRDHYIVVVEHRTVQPNEFGKGKQIENRQVFSFDDYAAAHAFYDRNNSYAATPHYENQQNINYLYALPARSAQHAAARMKPDKHYQSKLLAETPFSVLVSLKRYWDEERKARESIEQDSDLDRP